MQLVFMSRVCVLFCFNLCVCVCLFASRIIILLVILFKFITRARVFLYFWLEAKSNGVDFQMKEKTTTKKLGQNS